MAKKTKGSSQKSSINISKILTDLYTNPELEEIRKHLFVSWKEFLHALVAGIAHAKTKTKNSQLTKDYPYIKYALESLEKFVGQGIGILTAFVPPSQEQLVIHNLVEYLQGEAEKLGKRGKKDAASRAKLETIVNILSILEEKYPGK